MMPFFCIASAMMIHVSFFSILADWVGTPETVIELPDGATYGDLLTAIGRRYSDTMPDPLWDDGTQGFARPVIAFKNGHLLRDRGTLLAPEDRVRFMAAMGGG
jgi:molybdopterin converting factor small subunit